MNKKDYSICIALFLLGALSRFPLIEQFQSHWDGPLYSIAVIRYSLEQITPPPPGYPLYIAFGRFFYFFVHDPHIAILLVSVLFSGIGATTSYITGKILFNRQTGIISSLLFLSGSTFYYFGLTPYAYVLLFTMSSLVALCSYLIIIKQKKLEIVLGIIFAIAIGIRPQEVLFLIPLVIFSFLNLPLKRKIILVAVTCLILSAWFIPLMLIVGGFNSYFHTIINTSSALIKSAYSPKIYSGNLELMVKGFFLSLGIAGFFVFGYLKEIFNINRATHRKIILFYGLWILPVFLFNLFILSVHAGYQMDYLSAFVYLSAFGIVKYFNRSKNALLFFVLIAVGFNLLVFFWNRDPNYKNAFRPTSFHYSDIRKNDLKLGSKIEFIKNNFNVNSSIIITTSTFWSQYMYHLKQYHQYSLEGLFTNDSRYKYTRRDSFDWNIREYTDKKETFVVSPGVTNLILVDDEYETQLINLESKIYHLPGRSFIVSILVHPDDKIIYGYRYLKKL